MAIADDFAVSFVTGAITHVSGTTNYTVLELHRYLQALADDPQAAGGANDDILDASALNPSERITDEIINLLDYTGTGGISYNINDAAAEFLYGGSITQGTGPTQEIYSGLRVLGTVIDTATQLQIVQDKALYDGDAPFWGDQATPFNGGGNVLMRCLVKSRIAGCDIDKKQIIVQARNYFDSFAFFEVTLGTGEAVAAISTVDDPQNGTLQATVTAYTHVTNVEGFQTIDIGDGNGVQPYYSKWTYGVDTSSDGLKGMWEFVKDLTNTGTAKTIHGIDGELFRGITHTYVYDGLSGTFTEDEEVIWGTGITYNTLAGGTFTEGYYVRIGSNGAAGRVMYDNGTVQMTVALEDTSITLITADTITEYNPATGAASGVTAAINVTIVDNDKSGGLGILLANDTAGLKHHIQLRVGDAPVDNVPVRGLSSAATAAADTTITPRTVNAVFMGSYVGSLIGGFGFGVDVDDLAFPDTVIDLDGDTNSAPTNVTWTLNAVEVGEDYCMVGPKATTNDFEWDLMAINGALSGAAVTTVVVTTIPDNVPQVGTLRITADDGRRLKVTYTAHNGTTDFTVDSFDFSGNNVVATSNDCTWMGIDKLATVDPEVFSTVFDTPDTLWVRVRDGDTTPIKTYEAQSALSASGGSATASRISDE